MGERSKRRPASSTRRTRSASGRSCSCSSSQRTACLIPDSPSAMWLSLSRSPCPRSEGRGGDVRLLAVLPLVRGLPFLVDVLDAWDVLDGAPGRASGAAHGVHQRLADLVLGGAGLRPCFRSRVKQEKVTSWARGKSR